MQRQVCAALDGAEGKSRFYRFNSVSRPLQVFLSVKLDEKASGGCRSEHGCRHFSSSCIDKFRALLLECLEHSEQLASSRGYRRTPCEVYHLTPGGACISLRAGQHLCTERGGTSDPSEACVSLWE